jgi:hypothetical protein
MRPATLVPMFPHLLLLADGEPNDPAVFVTAIPNWSVGEVITVGNGAKLRVVRITDHVARKLVDLGLSGVVFTVEPV